MIIGHIALNITWHVWLIHPTICKMFQISFWIFCPKFLRKNIHNIWPFLEVLQYKPYKWEHVDTHTVKFNTVTQVPKNKNFLYHQTFEPLRFIKFINKYLIYIRSNLVWLPNCSAFTTCTVYFNVLGNMSRNIQFCHEKCCTADIPVLINFSKAHN